MGNLDLPFEPTPEGPLLDQDGMVSAGVVVMAATLPTDDGVAPAVVFRFAHADGSGFAPPIVLVTDDELQGLPGLVSNAVAAARTSAAAAR